MLFLSRAEAFPMSHTRLKLPPLRCWGCYFLALYRNDGTVYQYFVLYTAIRAKCD